MLKWPHFDPDNAVATALDTVFDAFGGIIPFDRIGYASIEDEGWAVHRWTRSKYERPSSVPAEYACRLDATSLPAIGRMPRAIDDLEEYGERNPRSRSTKLMLLEGIRSNLTFSVRQQDAPIGYLFFSSCEPYTYSDIDRTVLDGVARLTTGVIDQAARADTAESDNSRLETELTLDPLTRVLSRRGFYAALRSSTADRQQCAVLFIDVDDFKEVNDRFGHAAGDEVLTIAAHTITSLVRRGDAVGRLGGDEFAVLLNAPTLDRLRDLSKRVVEGISLEAAQFDATVSVGAVMCHPGEDVDPEHLLSLADTAMYRAKANGRNTSVVIAGDDGDYFHPSGQAQHSAHPFPVI